MYPKREKLKNQYKQINRILTPVKAVETLNLASCDMYVSCDIVNFRLLCKQNKKILLTLIIN